MKRALKQLCQEGSVSGAGRLALAPWNTKGSRVVEDDGKGVAVAVRVAVLELNTFLQTTALIMTDPLDLVQRGCDRNNQRGGKKSRRTAIMGDDRHFSIVIPDWNRQEKSHNCFFVARYSQHKHTADNSAVIKMLL